MTDTSSVRFETSGTVATITLNRPNRRNAIDAAMTACLRDAVARLEADPTLRIGILTGAGAHFCAGMDLAAFMEGDTDNILFGDGGFAGFVKTRRAKPIIASVEGAALAGGFELVLACDLAVASSSARFGLPEAKLGLIAGGGGAVRLARDLPKALANDLLLTGRTIDAEEALSYGLLNEVVAEGGALSAAHVLAATIAANAPLSVAGHLALTQGDSPELWQQSDATLQGMLKTSDAREGATAFLSKRLPVWSGR